MISNDKENRTENCETETKQHNQDLSETIDGDSSYDTSSGCIEFECDNFHTKATINSLPDELLLKIFQFLPCFDLGLSAALVCYRWRVLSMDPSLWSLDLRYSSKPAEEILTITANLPWIRKILLPDRCIPLIIAPIASWCSNLLYYDIGHLHDRTEQIHLVEMLHHAESITYFHVTSPLIDLEMTELITKYMKNLRCIDFSFCIKFSDDCINLITKNVSVLELLNINGCELITDKGVKDIISMFSLTLQHFFLDGFFLSSDSLSLLKNCINLRTLSITYASSLDDSCHLGHLEHLNEFVARRTKDSLNHYWVKTLFLETLSHNFVHIDLTDCELLDDEVVKIMCERCRNLRCLVLAWCCSLTDISMESIVNNLTKLVSLNMFGNYGIEGKTLLQVDLQANLPNLLVLDFTCCDNVKEELLGELFSRNSSLYIFDYLGDCVGHEDLSHYNIWKLQYRGTQPSSFREKLRRKAGIKQFNMFLESFRC